MSDRRNQVRLAAASGPMSRPRCAPPPPYERTPVSDLSVNPSVPGLDPAASPEDWAADKADLIASLPPGLVPADIRQLPHLLDGATTRANADLIASLPPGIAPKEVGDLIRIADGANAQRKTMDIITDDGKFKVLTEDKDLSVDDIKSSAHPGAGGDGWLQVTTKDGDHYAIPEAKAPDAYAAAEHHYLDLASGNERIDEIREKAGLPARDKTDLYALETDIEHDGKPLKVEDAAMKLMIEDLRDRDLETDSKEAKLLRLLEADHAVTEGKDVIPVYEERLSGAGKATRTQHEGARKLEPVDMQDMLEGSKIRDGIRDLMQSDEIAKLHHEKLKEALDAVPGDGVKNVEKNLTELLEGTEYVKAISELPDTEMPRAYADIENAMSQLAVLDPKRAESASKTFANNALAVDFDATFADPSSIDADAAADAVDAGLGAISNGIDKAGLPFQLADKIEAFLKDAGIAGKQDFAKMAAELRGGDFVDHDTIDAAVDKSGIQGDRRESIRSLYHDLSSNGVLSAVTGAIGVVSTARQLAGGDLGETPEEKLATAGGLLSMIGSLPESTSLLRNLTKGIDGSTLKLLGVGDGAKDALDIKTRQGNMGVDAIGERVADTDIPDGPKVEHRDRILDQLNDAAKGGLDGQDATRAAKATFNTLVDYTGRVGGVLGAVTGGLGAHAALSSGDATDAEKASAVIGAISGTLGVVQPALSTASEFTTAAAAAGKTGASAGLSALRMISRVAGPLAIPLTIADLFANIFTSRAKSKAINREQYDWFNQLASDGVAKGDWAVKYDWVRTTLADFKDAKETVGNYWDLRNAKWGGRKSPEDVSIFEHRRSEFGEFKRRWEDKRQPTTYISYLDAGKHKEDMKRAKDAA
ncbi:hypothetical protein MNO14_01505 [Luteimonas sp. S4-F44]|uniref:hypothetical protein n=1 Tax=Luteimonas sp. S4-F44 TaxID=2925842 RepID=UPI001F53DA7E|nr:hypothetical protein [Luteimonas sp. S4-F44]UNK42810.1 hypothetical protein MNO14_01505 [Luteimonas sp. S4-F44]